MNDNIARDLVRAVNATNETLKQIAKNQQTLIEQSNPTTILVTLPSELNSEEIAKKVVDNLSTGN